MTNKQDEIAELKTDLLSDGYNEVMRAINGRDGTAAIESAIIDIIENSFAAGYALGKDNKNK